MQRPQNGVSSYPIDYESFAMADMPGLASTADFPTIGNEGLFPLAIPHQSSGYTADLGAQWLPQRQGRRLQLVTA